MEKDSLKNWLDARLLRVRKNAVSVQPDFFPESIHHLRTETKRLRAMLRLLTSQDDKEGKLPKSFRKLYKIAGSIRDPQIHLMELFGPRLPKMPLFSVWLARQMAPGIAEWQKKFSEETLDELKSFWEERSAVQPELADLITYFRNRKREIQQMLESDPDDEQLHQIRKYSKDLLYLLAFCEDHWPEAWIQLRHLESSLKRVSDRAGAFNDKRNLLDIGAEFLKVYEDELNEDELARAKQAIDRWASQKEQARKRMLASLRAFLRRKIISGNRRD